MPPIFTVERSCKILQKAFGEIHEGFVLMADAVVTVHVKVGDVEIFGEYDDGTIFPVAPEDRDAIRRALKNALRVLDSPTMDEVASTAGMYRMPAAPAARSEPKPRPRLRLVK